MSRRLLSALSALALPVLAMAQTLDYTESDFAFETGARAGVTADISLIPKTLGLSVGEELRMVDNFSRLGRSYTTLGIDYKLLPWLKAGAGYSLIANNSASKGWSIRNRYSFSLTESWKADRWKFSLREKIQGTNYGSDVNTYQQAQTVWALKTRFKVAYNIPHNKFDPYASAELRTLLNGANPAYFQYSTNTGLWNNTNPRYNDVYFNRLRLILGGEYKTPGKNTLDVYLIADLKWDLDIDFNKSGVQKYTTNSDGSILSTKDYLFLEDSCFLGVGFTYTFKLGKRK